MNIKNAPDLTPHFALQGNQPFKDRRATMPWRGAIPVAKEQLSQTWQNVISQRVPPRKRLVYLHIPFCATHCTFCGFYQNRFEEDRCVRYTDALIREIEMEADSVLHQSAPVHAVYFGGGTPSALSAQDLAKIITVLKDKLPLAPDCEITIEGRVLNFDDNRIDACLDAGANRFSIGIQSFNSKIRKKMARTSDGPTARAFMQELVKRDRAAVVCDLLFGLPGQDAKLWGEDLAIARDIGLDGVDLYALNLLPNTPLGKAVENGRTTVPSPAERRDLYLQGCDFMDAAGWRCISNSHWAHTTRERNLYNLLIKQGADCLAFGSGAGGSVNGYSWMVERNLTAWHEAIAAGKKPLMMMMRTAEPGFQWRHTLQAGVETARISLDELTPHAEKLAPLLSQWHQAGLTSDSSTCLRLTNEGRFWASNILQSLDELIQELNAPRIAVEKP
ncbi:heme anaerobic degradation radical SAM methyltransferase ChuW/HutW [Citrobacter amalonaticus]|uniref:Heme anaerobic degradation radical SAM methyltransferase ChuW/HutW n=1 Tax=Citrobacter amalonaticus TaxID=35703 RepID=A0A2S4S0I8_CITAM|nr:heme anaerobic degradation radical SAM methyltransferase ChuW/HutW [Citrobacter amalonaticus]POT58336.1 heme anaerobic degradation radical SAM methyltransferase ChuW/HutW [Citrobacter amalonaticus]POT76137.1 heme anaerobic degradation radical SAM methyltransferase ChuW/HutW [Citrobacter amalonaticus]POU66863.1 heme anaerobic degradation radical SAM methyltransferase ChuW/HutW [Citrobacter amalonaticus]POV05372.1 heme anaerobic degradation radical SAM methyltransferase ChuW/HutW [Citrobacter 